MIPIATSRGTGYAPSAPTEVQIFLGSVAAWNGNRPPLILCHGASESASAIYAKTGQRTLARRLAQHFAVLMPDLALDSWGNDTAIARIGDSIDYLVARGATSKAILVGISMGALNALNYARAHPEDVAAVIGIIPALDIADIMTRVDPTAINTAYGGTYSNATHGPTHNPVLFADDMDADLPIHLFTSSNDPFAVPATADAFVAARPQTHRTDLGAVGHADSSIAGAVEVLVRATSPYRFQEAA